MRPSFNSWYFRIVKTCSSVLFLVLVAGLFEEVWARVGGGHSYSGGRSRSSGGSGGGGGDAGAIYLIFRLLFWLTLEHPIIGIPVDIIVIALIVMYFSGHRKSEPSACSADLPGVAPTVAGGGYAPSARLNTGAAFNQLRRFDPNFSEITFTDFCYALYGKAQNARAKRGTLDTLSPYLSDEARAVLLQRNPANLVEVTGVIVGAMQVTDVRGLASPMVEISVEFESNYTEVVGQSGSTPSANTWYVRERWELERKRDVLSPTPEQATALHCPSCGAALQKDTQGACAFCGAVVKSGEFQWFVRRIALLSRESRGPLLTAEVEEVGTDYPGVVQPGFDNVRAAFEQNNPNFNWTEFQQRTRLIFNELQAAWSSLDWERARPHETDNIFQMHQYWIESYKRQGLRNVLDSPQILAMQPVKIKEDAFYNAITVRIFAQGFDYTVDTEGNVVAGSRDRLRKWSEYWTFIRNRNANPAHSRTDLSCPNCGAALKVNATGICSFCGGKITSGEFDWVLSKIEQDESYSG